MLVALAALITSVVAVVVGVYSAWIDRSFERASTWPHVEIYRTYSDSPTAYSIVVLNQGTGPAIVHYAIVEQDGERFDTWAKWLAQHYPDTAGFA